MTPDKEQEKQLLEMEMKDKLELVTDLIGTLKGLENIDLFVATHKASTIKIIINDDIQYNYVLDTPKIVSVKVVG